MSVLQRLLRGNLARNSSALLISEIVKTAMMLATVPVFSLAWGLSGYGIWLILFTIPNYIAFTDLGFNVTAINQMIDAAERGDHTRARSYFRATRLFTTIISVVVAGALAATLLVLPGVLDFAQPATGGQAHWVALALFGYGLVGLQTTIMLGGFRGTGGYAAGTNYTTATSALEVMAGMATAILSRSQLDVALAFLAVRAAGWALMAWRLRVRAPWLAGETDLPSWTLIRELWAKALSSFGVSMGMALTLQGAVAVIGAAGGPAIVPVYTATRTLSRFVPQLASSVSRGSMPLVTAAVARGDMARAQHLSLASLGASLGTALPATLALALIGPWVIKVWSGGVIAAPWLLVVWMSLAGMAYGLWNAAFNIQLAVNRHTRFALFYIPLSVLGLVLVYVMTRAEGLVGAGFAAFAVEAATAVVAMLMLIRQGLFAFGGVISMAHRLRRGAAD